MQLELANRHHPPPRPGQLVGTGKSLNGCKKKFGQRKFKSKRNLAFLCPNFFLICLLTGSPRMHQYLFPQDV